MNLIELRYEIGGRRRAAAGAIRNPLIELLLAVRNAGSIAAAAKALRLSYRHVWGELKRWEEELGQALIVWDKGQPARLTAFAERLLLAERLAQARLAPQIARLQADLEQVFATALDDEAQLLALAASHDEALAALRGHCAAARLHLELNFCGSGEALAALAHGRCVLAGFHVPPGAPRGSLAERTLRRWIKPADQVLIGFARRCQGLAVAPGNPLAITGVADLPRLRYVNRPPGTGTRLLLDQLLADAGISAEGIAGYTHTEPSHAAVAQAVAAGLADAGLCIEAVARAAGLSFVPVAQEDYWLVCAREALATPAVVSLLAALQSPAWQQCLAALPGYEGQASGQVREPREVLAWWPPARRRV